MTPSPICVEHHTVMTNVGQPESFENPLHASHDWLTVVLFVQAACCRHGLRAKLGTGRALTGSRSTRGWHGRAGHRPVWAPEAS